MKIFFGLFLGTIISGSCHVAAIGVISFFLWLSNIPLYIYQYFPSWDLPNPGLEHRSPALQVDSLPAEL